MAISTHKMLTVAGIENKTNNDDSLIQIINNSNANKNLYTIVGVFRERT